MNQQQTKYFTKRINEVCHQKKYKIKYPDGDAILKPIVAKLKLRSSDDLKKAVVKSCKFRVYAGCVQADNIVMNPTDVYSNHKAVVAEAAKALKAAHEEYDRKSYAIDDAAQQATDSAMFGDESEAMATLKAFTEKKF
jgi:hypothetical protein